jgi:VWFA-related protein
MQRKNHLSTRRVRLGALLALLILLLALAPSWAQRQRRAQEQFSDVTSVTVVEVPVNVWRKGGEPVRGLTADDFEVFEGRKQQEIVGFDVIDLGQEDIESKEVPATGRRYFMAYFDLSYSDPSAIGRATEAAADLVLNDLHPTDMVAVATYTRGDGPQLVLRFTPDRNQIRQAIETLGLVGTESKVTDPLGLLIADMEGPTAESGGGAGRAGVDSQAEFVESLRAVRVLEQQASRGEQASRLAERMSGLGMMAQVMGSIDGRKHFVYFSEGFDSELIFGRDVTDIRGNTEDVQAVESGATWQVDNQARFGDSQTRGIVDGAIEAMRRCDCTIEAIDIGVMQAGSKDMNLDALRYLASETGGDAYANFNDLGGAMGEMLDRTSVTYVLAYQAEPATGKDAGEYRPIRVKLKGSQRGTEIAHRPGYFPARPYAERSPIEKQLQAAQQVIGGAPGGDFGVSVLAGAFPASGKAYVPVLIEVDGPSVMRGFDGDVLPLEVYVYAQDRQGIVRGYFGRPIGLDPSTSGAALSETGVKYWGHLDLAPGRYDIRVLVRNAANGQSSLQIADVTVPEGDEVVLLPPMQPDDLQRWVFVREEEKDQRKDVEFPFLSQGQPYVPTARPTLAPRKDNVVHMVAYNVGDAPPAIGGLLVDAQGNVVAEPKVKLSGQPTTSGEVTRFDATVNPGKVDAGDYTLVLKLDGSDGDGGTARVPVRVGG